MTFGFYSGEKRVSKGAGVPVVVGLWRRVTASPTTRTRLFSAPVTGSTYHEGTVLRVEESNSLYNTESSPMTTQNFLKYVQGDQLSPFMN